MSGTEKLERDNPNLSWADWMDELVKETFEKKAQAWTRGRIAPVKAQDLAKNHRVDLSPTEEPV